MLVQNPDMTGVLEHCGRLRDNAIGLKVLAVVEYLTVTAFAVVSGWDTSVYVNEETRDSRVNPGRAVLISVGTLTVMYAWPRCGCMCWARRPCRVRSAT